jgi:alanine dehydrogenase
MIIGIPTEIKNNENRVGMTPAGVSELVKRGHVVYIQQGAGINSGFPDDEYTSVGAKILPTIADIYAKAEMIIKVKEPIEPEYNLIKRNQLLFTYFHFASDAPLFDAMMKSGSVCLAYETVQRADHSLPLLIPMSEVAGRMAVQEGARFLERPQGGKGILMGGVPGVKPAKVLVLGAGHVGFASALIAAGMGADVIITDISLPRLRDIANVLPKNVHTLYSTEHSIRKELPTTDLVIGSVLVPGDKTPHLITRDMLKLMQKGSVLVDVAIDQGGCFETSHPTTHSEPVYVVDGIVHYAVANIPGAVAYTSTVALTNATMPYAIALADKGWKKACRDDEALLKGLNIVDGHVTFKAVADLYHQPYVNPEQFI